MVLFMSGLGDFCVIDVGAYGVCRHLSCEAKTAKCLKIKQKCLVDSFFLRTFARFCARLALAYMCEFKA